eukprot:1211997-Rhodomonas_salina.1
MSTRGRRTADLPRVQSRKVRRAGPGPVHSVAGYPLPGRPWPLRADLSTKQRPVKLKTDRRR